MKNLKSISISAVPNFAILFFFALSFSFTSVAMAKNPQIKICNSIHGRFFVANGNNDQFGFCQIDSAVIGTIDLLRIHYGDTVLSVTDYSNGVQNCTEQITTFSFQGTDSFEACLFPDGSVIGLSTLTAGLNSAGNAKLNAFLGL